MLRSVIFDALGGSDEQAARVKAKESHITRRMHPSSTADPRAF
jgi:hypothetical protein